MTLGVRKEGGEEGHTTRSMRGTEKVEVRDSDTGDI